MNRTAVIAEYLKARAGRWVDGRELATVGGTYAWRTRVSEARKLGLSIENRVRSLPGGVKVSEYRVPEPVQIGLFTEGAA